MDSEINALKYFKDYLSRDKKTSCGNFSFEFYTFDFNANEDTKYYLSSEEKSKIKQHRVYLYRDGVRVRGIVVVIDDEICKKRFWY